MGPINQVYANRYARPQFAQLYLLDPDEAARSRLAIFSPDGEDGPITNQSRLKEPIMLPLSKLLHEVNPYAQAFKSMHQVANQGPVAEVQIDIEQNGEQM